MIPVGAWLLQGSLLALGQGAGVGDDGVDFVRDVQPILSDSCYHCHGPDAKQRKAHLRLDTEAGATQDHGGWAAVVPGRPDDSQLIRRINAESESDRMPPAEAHRPLSAEQRELLYRWIGQGAPWSKHWSFTRPSAPELPEVSDPVWPRNPIDHFILARLDEEGLGPAPPAPSETLLRRLSLDLSGLPPTPKEREEFVEGDTEDRWQRATQRLLDSPRYGERMAWPWLDAARYADSNGYQGDKDRSMWPWRDWVVRAFNQNLPFDEFTVWQIAGDLLQEPTDEQRLATAFLRNHMINGEGGRIAEENRVEYVFDQLETVGTVWLGLTMNCCRCHDHKYDPLTNQNYYELFAFFNQTPVTGASDDPRTAPALAVPDAEQRAQIQGLVEKLAVTESQLAGRAEELAAGRAAWEQDVLNKVELNSWRVVRPSRAVAEHQELTVQADHSVLATGVNPVNDTYEIRLSPPPTPITGLRLEALRDERMTGGGMARSNSGNFVLTELEVSVLTADSTIERPGSRPDIAAASASIEQGGFPVQGVLDEDPSSGWAIWEGKPIDRDHEAVFRFAEPLTVGPGAALQVVLRHDSKHEHHNLGRFRFSVTEDPSPAPEGDRRRLAALLATPETGRTDEQSAQLEEVYLGRDERHAKLARQRGATAKELAAARGAAPRVMVMGDQAEPRETFILQKGLYNQPRAQVVAALPTVLPALPEGSRADRLGLARWLVAPENPLTARVVVNRLWAQFFGAGLVKTTENFGSQGDRPSHPELLDWLAAEFIRSGWDVKHMVRLIVDSATYRQSSGMTQESQARDPENRLLARGPRFRLPSWMIRDQALQVSGLLMDQLGGAGVRPYQPAGVWREYTFGNRTYKPDEGDALYRRSLYTFWRRIVAPTMFFDAASRQTCSVKSRRTNTPLHALATLNDTTYVEAARALAERLLLEAGADDNSRFRRAFRLVLSREPVEEELGLLRTSIARLRRQYSSDMQGAEALLSVGQSPWDSSLEPEELAAWTGLCLALLNLDETVTKE